MEGEILSILGRYRREKLGMIIDVLCGEVRLTGKIINCGLHHNEHMKVKVFAWEV